MTPARRLAWRATTTYHTTLQALHAISIVMLSRVSIGFRICRAHSSLIVGLLWLHGSGTWEHYRTTIHFRYTTTFYLQHQFELPHIKPTWRRESGVRLVSPMPTTAAASNGVRLDVVNKTTRRQQLRERPLRPLLVHLQQTQTTWDSRRCTQVFAHSTAVKTGRTLTVALARVGITFASKRVIICTKYFATTD